MNIYVLQFSQNVRISEYFDRNNFKILVRKISDFLIMLQTMRIGANHAMCRFLHSKNIMQIFKHMVNV